MKIFSGSQAGGRRSLREDGAKSPEPGANEISAGLVKIRRRRRFFWILVAVYLPSIWASLRITRSDAFTMGVFLTWFALVIVAASLVCFSPCPRCGNHFHMSGFMPVWLRRCIHCRLHLRADKRDKPI